MDIQSVFFHIRVSNSSFTYSKLSSTSIVNIQQSHHTSYMQRNILSFFKTDISCQSSSSSAVVAIHIANIHLVIVNCLFLAKSSVLQITQQFDGKSGSKQLYTNKYTFYGIMLNITVDRSVFSFVSSNELGGAFYIHIAKHLTPAVFAKFCVSNSTFHDKHIAAISGSTKRGGALFVNAEENKFAKGEGVDVIISWTKFINCSASEQGGCIYLGKNIVKIQIAHCFFVSNFSDFSGKGYFMYSESKLILSQTILKSTTLEIETSMLDLPQMSDISNVNIKCPKWFFVSNNTEDTKLSIYCTTCSEPMYAPYFDHFKIKYHYMTLLYHQKYISTIKCNLCPYGAECQGGELKLLSGYWGMIVGASVEIYKCPHGYCCQESACNFQDSCTSNRVGVLCGGCKDGFSLSLLSNDCIDNKKCRNAWFWLLTSFSALLYTVWFSSKGILFSRIVNVYFIKNHFKFLVKKRRQCHRDKVVWNITVDHSFSYNSFFGILVFYVQITAVIHTELENVELKGFVLHLNKMIAFTSLLLSPNPKQISLQLCSFHHLSHEQRGILWITFFVAIFSFWLLLYLLSFLIGYIVNHIKMLKLSAEKYNQIKQLLIISLIDIIKYTYLGLTSVILMSGICLNINGEKVWFYDGSQKCFSTVQIFLIILLISYTFLFPFSLVFAQNCLKKKTVPASIFLLGCIFPLFIVLFLAMKAICIKVMQLQGKVKPDNISDRNESPTFAKKVCKRDRSVISTAEVILGVLEGPYRKDVQCMYWESMLCFYRLSFIVSLFVRNLVIKYIMIQTFCLLSLIHHALVKPYIHSKSNNAAILSLICLCAVGFINGIKAGFITTGFEVGPDSVILKILSLTENVFTLFLFFYMPIQALLCAYVQKKNQLEVW